MLKAVVCITALLVVSAAANVLSYDGWRAYHKLVNPSSEVERSNFDRAVVALKEAQMSSPYATFTLGPQAATEWWTQRRNLGGSASLSQKTFTDSEISAALSTSKDWQLYETGYVTRVKNQGACGSCWAFSVIAAVESMYHISGQPLTALSEQYVLDCLAPQLMYDACIGGKIQGLAGGLAGNPAWKLPLEREYEYDSYDNSTHACNHSAIGVVSVSQAMTVGATGSQHIEDAMAAWVHQYGPIVVGVSAWQPAWQLYDSGISECPAVTANQLDHGVTIVGYGSEMINGTSIPYWKIKNSWTPMWGEGGYIRLRRGINACGLKWLNTVVNVNV